MQELLLQSLLIFILIILLTFLQKFHYKMLYFISSKYHNFVSFIFRFIIRFGVIIHELAHLFFGILSGAKIDKVELFRVDGGKVTFRTKNYIGHLSQYSGYPGYMMSLFFNQIGIFLTSIGPLIFGMIFTFILVYYFNLPLDYKLFYDYLLAGNLDFKTYLFILLYIIFIPSFLLSFQDIKNFIISKQDTIGATIIGSIINTFIFICFLLFLTFFFDYLVVFFMLYLVLFGVLFLIFIVHYIFYFFRR